LTSASLHRHSPPLYPLPWITAWRVAVESCRTRGYQRWRVADQADNSWRGQNKRMSGERKNRRITAVWRRWKLAVDNSGGVSTTATPCTRSIALHRCYPVVVVSTTTLPAVIRLFCPSPAVIRLFCHSPPLASAFLPLRRCYPLVLPLSTALLRRCYPPLLSTAAIYRCYPPIVTVIHCSSPLPPSMLTRNPRLRLRGG
jgi:hypothetical protein